MSLVRRTANNGQLLFSRYAGHDFVCGTAGTPNTSVLARSSSSVNGRVEVMMSHIPDGQGGGGTPKPSFKVASKKSTIHELMQVFTWPPIQHMVQELSLSCFCIGPLLHQTGRLQHALHVCRACLLADGLTYKSCGTHGRKPYLKDRPAPSDLTCRLCTAYPGSGSITAAHKSCDTSACALSVTLPEFIYAYLIHATRA